MKLQIISDGTRRGTTVKDLDTGSEWGKRCTAILFESRPGARRQRITLELLLLPGDEVDVVAGGAPSLRVRPSDGHRRFRLQVPAEGT